jgi:hypothetical protein
MKKALTAAAILAVVASMLAGPAFAAKGGGGKGGGKGRGQETTAGYRVDLVEADPHLGGLVSFTFEADGVKEPRIQVMCYQGGEQVYGESGPAGNSFLLGGGWSLWLERGGAADCVADLYYWDWNRNNEQVFVGLATTAFTATG